MGAMNPFKNVFKSRKSASLDILTNFVRASKSASSISVETVDLDTASNSEWSLDEDRQTVNRRPDVSDQSDAALRDDFPIPKNSSAGYPDSLIPPDVEPNWSALPLMTFSREVYDDQPTAEGIKVVSVVDMRKAPSSHPYYNLALSVVAELHQVLSLKLPRYMVALLSNYRYINASSGRREEVEQIDLYLTNVQECLNIVRNCDGHDYHTMLHHCGKTVAVLASVLELIGRNASVDVFLLSFQSQMISAFDCHSLRQFHVKTQYLDYLKVSDNKDSSNSEIDLADSKCQTDTCSATDASVQTTLCPFDQPEQTFDDQLSGMLRFIEQLQTETAELQQQNHYLREDNVLKIRQLEEESEQHQAASAILISLQSCYSELQQQYDEVRQDSGDHAAVGGLLNMTANVICRHTTEFGELIQSYSDQLLVKASRASRQVLGIHEKRDKLFQEFAGKEAYLKRLLEEIVSRDAELSDLSEMVATLKKDLAKQHSEAIHCRRSLAAIIDSNATANAALTARITALSNALSIEQDRLATSSKENACLIQQVFTLTEEVKRRHTEYSAAESKIRAITDRTQGLEDRLKVASETLQATQKERDALFERANNLESTRGMVQGTQQAFLTTIKKKDEMVRKIEAALHAAISDCNELRSDVAELKRQRKVNLESIERLNRDAKDAARQLSDRNLLVVKLEEFLKAQAVEQGSVDQTAKIASLQDTVKMLNERIQSFEVERSNLIQQTLNVTVDRQDEHEHRSETESFTSYGQDVEAHRHGDLSGHFIQLTDLRGKLQNALAEIACQKMVVSSQNSSYAQLTEDFKSQGARLAESLVCNDELSRNLTEMQAQFTEAENAISTADKLRIELASVNALYGSLLQSSHEAMSREISLIESSTQTVWLSAVDLNTERDGVGEKVRQLKTQCEDQNNVIRAMEYGKENLNQRILGLETDNRTNDKRIKDLQQQLANEMESHARRSETASKDYDTKLRDALSRLAQKGEQLELAKSNVEKLLKRQEEMSREIAENITLKNQADLRIERISDQASRDIDELELQIKCLREQEHKRALEFQKVDFSAVTDQMEFRNSSIQTGWSFQHGSDLESGRPILSDIFCRQSASKTVQTEWPSRPCHIGVQINPLQRNVALQTSVNSCAAFAQTDKVDSELKFAQTEAVEQRSFAVQTIGFPVTDASVGCQETDFSPDAESAAVERHLAETNILINNRPDVLQLATTLGPDLREPNASRKLSTSENCFAAVHPECKKTVSDSLIDASQMHVDNPPDTVRSRAIHTRSDPRYIPKVNNRIEQLVLVDAATSVFDLRLMQLTKGEKNVDTKPNFNGDHEGSSTRISFKATLSESSSTSSLDSLSSENLDSKKEDEMENFEDRSYPHMKNAHSGINQREPIRRKLPTVSSVSLRPPAKPLRVLNGLQVYERKRNSTRLAFNGVNSRMTATVHISDKSSLRDICQYVYDSMLKDVVTENILIDISNGLDYSLGETEFDRHFAEQFLVAFDETPLVRHHFYQENDSSVAVIISRLRALVRSCKTVDQGKTHGIKPWTYPGIFKRRNDRDISIDLSKFFERILALSLHHPDQRDTRSFFDPENPCVKDGRIDVDQFSELSHFNAYVAHCFLRLAYASRNLRQVFHPIRRKLLRLSYELCVVRFAVLALQFSRKSNKMRELLSYELNTDVATFFGQYRIMLDINFARLLPNEARLVRSSNGFVYKMFGFR